MKAWTTMRHGKNKSERRGEINETSTQFKARCLLKDLGRDSGIRYAEKIGNREYQEAAEYIKNNTNVTIMSYRGNN